LVTKFVTSLHRRLAEQASAQALAATERPAGAYTLEEVYRAALQVQAVSTRPRIARELNPRSTEVGGVKRRDGATVVHGASSVGQRAEGGSAKT
jgi:hypothetical protein